MKRYILSLDEGTTGARAILFDQNAREISSAQREFRQIYPQAGYVEHDPEEIYTVQCAVMREAMEKVDAVPEEIAGIGITNQRETTVVWDRKTGKPVYNAIVWQCRRTAEYCEELIRKGLRERVRQSTGLLIDAYFSATKIKWILDHVEGARERAERGDLLFGTIDTWLLWKLSGGRIHVTDYTNASRTMLFDIHSLCWDKELLRELDIPEGMLPRVKPSSKVYGEILLDGVPIPAAGIAGDQQAALFGQCCFQEGELKNTYGTGCFLLMNTGETAVESRHGLLTTVAASAPGRPVQYALEGSVFVGGAVVQWLRDELCMIGHAAETERLAQEVASSGGVYIVPAFAGLGAPYWDMYARGTICGLTRGSNRNHIVRAALESIAYQTDDLIAAMRADSKMPIDCVKADGGASANGFLMQFQADISSTRVCCPGQTESTALGAAFLAGLAVGFWENEEQLRSLVGIHREYTPHMEARRRETLLDGWRRAVASARHFSKEDVL